MLSPTTFKQCFRQRQFLKSIGKDIYIKQVPGYGLLSISSQLCYVAERLRMKSREDFNS